jgi:hypothetical protein
MTDVAFSVDGVPIRLTDERWFHIVENHDDMAGYYDDILEVIENPEWVLLGQRGSEMAACSYGHKRFLVVIYRKISRQDGFVITAFFTDEIDRKKAIWKRQ